MGLADNRQVRGTSFELGQESKGGLDRCPDCGIRSAYLTGDAYMAFAIQAGAVPEGSTKKTHP